MAVLADRRIVLVWRSQGADGNGRGIQGQVFAADGSPIGIEFTVNTATLGDQNEPGIQALTGGGFVVYWTETNAANGDGSSSSIKAQLYGADGSRIGAEFVANTIVANPQQNPNAAALPGGGFILTWSDGNGFGDVAAQFFSAAGEKIGSQFLVNTSVDGAQFRPSIAVLDDGRFVITWMDFDIRAQMFEADGTKVGPELLVNQVASFDQQIPVITALAGGGFVIAWEDNSSSGATGGPEIKARIYGSGGAPIGDEFQVNTETYGSQYGVFVAALANGGFAVTWTDTSRLGGDASGNSVKLQLFDAFGNRVGSESLVTAVTGGDQYATGIAADGNDIIVAWADLSGRGGDASGSSIKFSRLVASPATEGPDLLAGTERDDTIHGLGGDDRIDGGGGSDILYGGPGNDLLIGGDGDDLLDLTGGGSDEAHGGAGNDGFYFGATYDAFDVADGGAGDDQIGLQGSYAALQLSAFNLGGIETIALLTGLDYRFAEPIGQANQYALSVAAGTLSWGQRLTINGGGLEAIEHFTFDGRQEANGHFRIFGGLGTERLTGGQQSDGFFFGEDRFSAAERIDGVAGSDDQLALFGDYQTRIVFEADTIRNIDTIVFISGRDPRYAAYADYFVYNIQVHDANLAAGATMTVTGAGLFLFESMIFDGSRETDGSFRIIGGGGDDQLSGGAQADVIYGGHGGDVIRGGGGADRFIYLAGDDSHNTRRDVLVGFDSGDVIDLSAIDADPATAGNQAFHWAAGSVFTGSAGEALLVQSGSEWLLQIDLDGVHGFDFILGINPADGYVPTQGDVIL